MKMPTIFLHMELTCFAILILIVIALNIRKREGSYSFDQKLFLGLINANILLLLFDIMVRSLNGKPGNRVRLLCTLIIVAYNVLNPVICMIWYYYVYYYIFKNKVQISKVFFPLLLPTFINTFLSIISAFFNVYFILDENNVYAQGRYIYVLLGICLYMIGYTTVFLIKNQKEITRKEFLYFLFFAIPPAIGGILHVIFSGVSVIWIAATLSIYIIFINIQKEQMYTDYLTGVNNRRGLDNFLEIRTKTGAYKWIAGIMIDIDAFKMINDEHGHGHGDQALIYTAKILRETFRKTDFIGRYGGDEFVVVMEIEEPSELALMVKKLKENVSQFNSQKLAPYEILLSIGYDYYEKESGVSREEFLKRIDSLMYLDKQKNY